MVDEELQKLIARRDELLKRIEAIETDYRQGLDADSEERAVQLENAEVLEGIGKAAVEELEEIEKKLAEFA
ncbi:hypothetical protein [Sulfuriflexus mobilis]|uniref:hypothetical protein n=1 Tax=Sulfuriflexus mobilis TaxID=1811807 RepID=UPI000F82018C|nr:hypothetical protein [Sulfuriflexus mobilis]